MARYTLTIPHVPPQMTVEEAEELVQEELENNHWEAEIPSPVLEFVPFFVFHFDSFSESEQEGSKIRNVDESMQGENALNAVSNALDEVIAELASPEVVKSEYSVAPDLEAKVKDPRFQVEDAKVAAQIKIAAQEKIPKANVHVSGMRLVYIPFWVYKIALEEGNEVILRMNAVTGEFMGEESGVPYRGQTKGELLRETVSDLKSPEGWSEYIQNFVKDIILLFQTDKEHPNRRMIIFILLVIILVLLGVGFVKWPTPQ